MLKLVNVSKYYYSKGVVTSGFSRVNLEMRRGEFIAITGESGSGKSTLLNVISGLDSYEEGEMYIFGEETSGYTETDFENYRKRYIANIFQSFNLVNSYTVYQNVELALVLNGKRRREYRRRILEVLKQVGLYKFRNARASRLSGGQKQRVAIARALVKDTPVIVADEPTGNLDTQSAENVWELLSSVAKDKLVVVVTHNYEQAEPYVTRKITMHDGQVIEDRRIREPEEKQPEEEDATSYTGRLKPFQKLRLGVRNTFNIIPKFLLLLFIFLFVSAAVAVYYSNTLRDNYVNDTSGYNYFFSNTDVTRIIIQKQDRSPITEEDYGRIETLPGVERVVREDILVDSNVYLWSDNLGFGCYVNPIEELDAELIAGNMPESDDEVILLMHENGRYRDQAYVNTVLTDTYQMETSFGNGYMSTGDTIVRISGIAVGTGFDEWRSLIYVTDGMMKKISSIAGQSFGKMKVEVAGKTLESNPWDVTNQVVPADWVPQGMAVVSEDWNYMFKNYRAKGKTFTVKASTIYYESEITSTISDVYTSRNFTKKTGLDEYYRGVILVNTDDYNSLFDQGFFQSTVMAKDHESVETLMSSLEDMGFSAFHVNSHLVTYDGAWEKVSRLITTVMGACLMLTLFVVSYFIIRLIMRSRNTYYSTVRILGGTAGECRDLIVIELFTVLNLAFAGMLGALWAAREKYYTTEITDNILKYLSLRDYVILYVILAAVCLWIALRYSRQLFKNSAINTLKGV